MDIFGALHRCFNSCDCDVSTASCRRFDVVRWGVEQANEMDMEGKNVADTTRQSTEVLKDTVGGISGSVEELSSEITRIAKAAGIIEQIADQSAIS